jgi:hypothetical protein
VAIDGFWIDNWIYWTQITKTVSLNYSKDHCNYSTHKFFSVFISRCLVEDSNCERSPSSGLPNLASATRFSLLRIANLNRLNNNDPKYNLLYDWRFTANQFILAPSPLRPTTLDFFFQLNNLCNEKLGMFLMYMFRFSTSVRISPIACY